MFGLPLKGALTQVIKLRKEVSTMYSTIYVLWDRPDKDKILEELRKLGWEDSGLVDLVDNMKKSIRVVVMLRRSA